MKSHFIQFNLNRIQKIGIFQVLVYQSSAADELQRIVSIFGPICCRNCSLLTIKT